MGQEMSPALKKAYRRLADAAEEVQRLEAGQGDLSLSELASILGVSESSLKEMAEEDSLPGAYKLHRMWRVSRLAVLEMRGLGPRAEPEAGGAA